jgi:acetyl esterase/lipase
VFVDYTPAPDAQYPAQNEHAYTTMQWAIANAGGIGADEGEAYARKLSQADVPVTQVRYGGTIYDFVLLNPITGTPRGQPSRRPPATCAAS